LDFIDDLDEFMDKWEWVKIIWIYQKILVRIILL
jgi:hypothetical protein